MHLCVSLCNIHKVDNITVVISFVFNQLNSFVFHSHHCGFDINS